MRIIEARNVHEALPRAVQLLFQYGIRRDSRNGPVLVAPWPVTTIYHRPYERVLFWPQRDANPFFHLYESLWMLSGRADLAPLMTYVKRMETFSDDGQRLRGAYGARWRSTFGKDQLLVIAERLQNDPNDRRNVLQIWDAALDLNTATLDAPCNLTATFQLDREGALDMVVFCRSNDIVWGCYGANAVHFSMLQEFMACLIGCPMGTYTQVSVNWHGYLDTLQLLRPLLDINSDNEPNPYVDRVTPTRLTPDNLDSLIKRLCCEATGETFVSESIPHWAEVFQTTLDAHTLYREKDNPHRLQHAVDRISEFPARDWCVAGREWFERRRT